MDNDLPLFSFADFYFFSSRQITIANIGRMITSYGVSEQKVQNQVLSKLPAF